MEEVDEAFVRLLTTYNVRELQRRHELQRRLSHVCRTGVSHRRGRRTEPLLTCGEAAAIEIADRRARGQVCVVPLREECEGVTSALLATVARLTGQQAPEKGGGGGDTSCVLEAIRAAESCREATERHLAHLDAMAADTELPRGVQKLAAIEAAKVRGIALVSLPSDMRWAEKVASRAAEEVDSERPQRPAIPPPTAEEVREHLNAVFDMGFITSLWDGIESSLPDDIRGANHRMPDALALSLA
jgi:hypothetical protein